VATLTISANGSQGSYGSAARPTLVVAIVASGVCGQSGSANATIIQDREVHVTQAGVQFDVSGVIDARVTEIGVQADVGGLVPVRSTEAGVNFDVDRLVPTRITEGGIGLDVDRIVPTRITAVGINVDARQVRRQTTVNCWEFHVENRGGTYLALLDGAFQKSWLDQLNDAGGGSFMIHANDDKATATNLKVGNIVKVRYRNVDIGAWVIEEVSKTLVDTGEEATKVITCSGRGLLGSLEKALVYPSDLEDATTAERAFTTETKAGIIKTLYDEFLARGGGILTTTFTDAVDTDLDSWTDSVTMNFKAGQTVLAVLRQLCALGLEVTTNPDRSFNAYLAAGSDLSSSVVFRHARNILASTYKEMGADMANAGLAEARGLFDESTDATSISTYGRQEQYLPIQNTSDNTLLGDANDLFVSEYKDPITAITLSVTHENEYPGIDYNVGDTVRVEIPGEVSSDYRIRGIAIQEGTGPCDLRVHLELNSVEMEYLQRVQMAFQSSLTTVKPGAATASQIGATTTSTTGAGVIKAGDLDDVSISGVADDDILGYDSGSGNWINQDPSELGILSAAGDVVGGTSEAQDFGSNGVKADAIVESTGDAGVTVEGVTLIDSTIGIGTASPVSYLDVTAAVAGRASMNIGAGTVVSSPNDGDIWYTGGTLFFHAGTVTRSIDWT